MPAQVGCGLGTQSTTPSVYVVMGQDGINRTHIDIVGLASLHGVLQKGFQYEDDILHAFDIRRIVDELVH